MPTPEKRNYLKTWLAEDAGAATVKRNQRRRRMTSGGLEIVLYVDAGDLLHMRLARQGKQPPSDQEAATVLNCLPESARPVEAPKWRTYPDGTWRCLAAVWPLPTHQKTLPLGQVIA